MANLTISVDAETLKSARLRAIKRGESVNRFLAERLREYAFADDATLQRQREAEKFVELSRKVPKNSDGRPWSRADLYRERLDRDV